jgi:hypothetical protein
VTRRPRNPPRDQHPGTTIGHSGRHADAVVQRPASGADPETRKVMDLERRRIDELPEEERDAAVVKFAREATVCYSVPEPLVQRMRDIRRRMLILCLSENDRSILMWSHYADQHRGVVLGFDATAMENGSKRPFEPVRYCDALPRLIDSEAWSRSIVFGLPAPGLEGKEREWALTKHTDWQYEREWRFVWISPPGTQGDYQDITFPRDALVEVVSGCRTDATRSVELLALARAIHPAVRHYRISIHPSRFELIKASEGHAPAGCDRRHGSMR